MDLATSIARVSERAQGIFKDVCTVDETFFLSYVFLQHSPIFDLSAISMLEAGHPGLVLCDNLRDRVERKVGGEFRLAGGICIPMANSC